jgi:hypothetical protein
MRHAWPGLAAAACMALLAGCVVMPPPSFTAIESRTAAVEWRHGGDPETFRVEFESGDADSLRIVVFREKRLLALVRVRGEWIATGALAHGGWRGTWNTAPPEISGWLCLAEAFDGGLHAPQGDSEFRTGRMSVRYSKSPEGLREFELAAVATNDRFRVRF